MKLPSRCDSQEGSRRTNVPVPDVYLYIFVQCVSVYYYCEKNFVCRLCLYEIGDYSL